MIANVSKNNTGKLLVAIMAMFLVVVGATVVLSDNTSAAPEQDDVAAIGETGYDSLGEAITAAQAKDTPVTIELIANAELDAGDYNLTDITIDCSVYTINMKGAVNITEGTINGTGKGTTGSHQIIGVTSSAVSFNGTEFNSNAVENMSGKGTYAYFILTVSGTSATFTGCTFNTTQTGDWGVIYDGVSTLTLDDCDFNQIPKVNYTNTNGKNNTSNSRKG